MTELGIFQSRAILKIALPNQEVYRIRQTPVRKLKTADTL
jgi:hypothetical protein